MFFVVTNPIDVIKVRLQLDNELTATKNIFANRKYRGFLHGGMTIVKEEGIGGLYKGYTYIINYLHTSPNIGCATKRFLF